MLYVVLTRSRTSKATRECRLMETRQRNTDLTDSCSVNS